MEKLAEFIGIMLGDGYFGDTRLKITLNSVDDFEYMGYVSRLINSLFGEKAIIKFRKNEKTVDLFIFKRKVLNYLTEKGLLKSPKRNTATIPKEFLKFDLAVLRGYFDTDGSVVITNNNGTIYPRLEMKVCPSPMQGQFVQILRKHKFRFGVYEIGRGEVRIQMNGKKELKKWSNLVGFSNKKHLRKAQRFLKNKI